MVLQTKEIKAMILAAGLGTRLRPLTDHKPKALLEWNGITLLESVITKLKGFGIREIIINVHHFHEMIMDFVKKKQDFGIRIEFSNEKDELLDTGGGIAKASWFFGDEPFLVYNVDIQSNINLQKLLDAHQNNESIATMAVKERVTTRSLLMDRNGLLKGWRDNRTGKTIIVDPSDKDLVPIAFSAIQIMDPEIFEYFPEAKVFPLIPFYLELAKTEKISLYRHDRDSWMDMGRLESFS